MIELHFHCLPGIDDGPRNWDEAVSLCRAAAADGATAIVATPHVLRPPWINDEAHGRDELVSRLNALLEGKPPVLAGCEYYFSSDAVELWEMGADGPLTGLNRSSALLVEFPSDIDRKSVESTFHEFSILGVTPVVAHPERHPMFAEDLEWLASLISRGARVQITAASVAGDFGARAMSVCDRMLKRGLVHLVASDAHSLQSRPPRLSAARERIRRQWGEEVERAIFEENPAAVVKSQPLPWVP